MASTSSCSSSSSTAKKKPTDIWDSLTFLGLIDNDNTVENGLMGTKEVTFHPSSPSQCQLDLPNVLEHIATAAYPPEPQSSSSSKTMSDIQIYEHYDFTLETHLRTPPADRKFHIVHPDGSKTTQGIDLLRQIANGLDGIFNSDHVHSSLVPSAITIKLKGTKLVVRLLDSLISTAADLAPVKRAKKIRNFTSFGSIVDRCFPNNVEARDMLCRMGLANWPAGTTITQLDALTLRQVFKENFLISPNSIEQHPLPWDSDKSSDFLRKHVNFTDFHKTENEVANFMTALNRGFSFSRYWDANFPTSITKFSHKLRPVSKRTEMVHMLRQIRHVESHFSNYEPDIKIVGAENCYEFMNQHHPGFLVRVHRIFQAYHAKIVNHQTAPSDAILRKFILI